MKSIEIKNKHYKQIDHISEACIINYIITLVMKFWMLQIKI